MTEIPAPISPDRWIFQIFSAKSAVDGGIVRRKISDVEQVMGRDRFFHEVRRRGYRVIENAGQFIIICNRQSVRLWE